MADQAPPDSSIQPASSQPKLLERVRHAVRVRHYSRRTEEAYVHWIRRYIVFNRKKHPSAMGAPEISAFLTWLAVEQRVSASTQNQALSAVLFLYKLRGAPHKMIYLHVLNRGALGVRSPVDRL